MIKFNCNKNHWEIKFGKYILCVNEFGFKKLVFLDAIVEGFSKLEILHNSCDLSQNPGNCTFVTSVCNSIYPWIVIINEAFVFKNMESLY